MPWQMRVRRRSSSRCTHPHPCLVRCPVLHQPVAALPLECDFPLSTLVFLAGLRGALAVVGFSDRAFEAGGWTPQMRA